ncbi:MAG: ABC transporter ATP-binding protein/permease [Thermoanaerobaculia bacterium]|nr:ABC transporter ATP-binding protein/permease [Thermoanaerobaculia bacterium]
MSAVERFEDEGTKKLDPRLTLRLLGYLRPYRMRAGASVALVILSSFAEIAGPAIVAIAIDLFVVPRGSESAGVSRQVGEWLASVGMMPASALDGITAATLLYLATLGGGFIVLYVQMVVMNMMGQRIMFDLRRQIFGHMQRLHVQYFDRNPVGRLITRVTTDVDALNEMFTAGFVAIFGDIFVLLGIVAMLFWLNWKLALVLFSVIPFLVITSLWFRAGARRTYRMVRARIAAINAFLQEHISGMAVVQLFNRQEREAEKFADLNAKHRDANIESIYYYSVFYPVIELVQSIGIALIVWYGGGQVVQGTLSIGALIAFFQYAQRFYEPISDLSEKYNILQSAMAASERIFKLLDTPVEIDDPAEPAELGELREIEFRNVWFAYTGEEWVLRNVSFVVKKGERLALVGHTGAGKTTVTSLLLRFYEVQRGEILVNGVDIRKYRLADLRRMFAIVQQDVFLFSGTVADNVSLGDATIGRQRIEDAVRRVRAARFVERLPEGYDAPVRERGAGFSVGEKQLLSFARALAFDPPVLVLDEATSSIDSETERLIQEAIEILMEGRTTVAIAHRLSTIRCADQILVFHHGEIRERGTHEELLRVDGIYRRLYELQYREERGEAASA